MAHDDPTGPADVLELETPASDAPAGLETAEYEAPSMPAAADDPTGETGVGIDDEAAEQQEAALSPARPVVPLPITPVPLPLRKRNVTGRYRGQVGSFQLEARVDLDGAHPLNKFSGDFFSVSGGTTTYFGSFIVESPVITRTATQVTARGLGKFTWGAGAPVVQVTVPRRSILQPAAPATVQFFTTSGSPGAAYVCAFEATGLRRVVIETDRVSDVTTPVFNTYNTGSLPSGGPARNLSVVSAFAEAGIEMVTSPGNVVNIGDAGANHSWSDAELHASMVRHFSRYRNEQQWAVWQLVCQRHDIGPGLYGIMFDQLGLQRQGCAVFHQGIGGTTPDKLRLQAYTYVHELGHCFNLLHSWQKSFANPPGVNRPTSLSWMNYPWNYPGGAAAFWSAFPFRFDNPELTHLRHGFRKHVIMGGDPFATHAAVIDPQVVADPIRDESGFRLEIQPHRPNYVLGEPVILSFQLSVTDRRGKVAHPHLHPKASMTSLAIHKPNGETVAYEPYIDHLMDSQPRFLADGEVIEETAYIGYGAGGLYFDRPGTYKLRAIYQAPDGSQVFSNIAELRVRHPVTQGEEELADLLMGDEQGALFYLLGSDSEALSSGNRAFDTVLEKHAKSPLADYVQAVRGVNAARTFIIVDDAVQDRAVVRQPDLAAAADLLTAATAPSSRIDDLSKAEFLVKLAAEQKAAGDEKSAEATESKAAAIRPKGK
jgi:hypothetical protein